MHEVRVRKSLQSYLVCVFVWGVTLIGKSMNRFENVSLLIFSSKRMILFQGRCRLPWFSIKDWFPNEIRYFSWVSTKFCTLNKQILLFYIDFPYKIVHISIQNTSLLYTIATDCYTNFSVSPYRCSKLQFWERITCCARLRSVHSMQ